MDDGKILPNRWLKMKDSIGFRKVRVYNNIEFLRMVLDLRIKAQAKQQDSIYLVAGLEGCQPKGNVVLMADGRFKNIEDIRVGDSILSPLTDGSYIFSKVLELHQFYSPKNYIVKAKNRGHKELYSCSYNHIIPLNKVINHRIVNNRNHRWREWSLINKTADEIFAYKDHILTNSTTPLAYPIPNFSNNTNCSIEPYTLGVFLGDGSLSSEKNCQNSRASLAITTNDPIIIDYISKCYPNTLMGNNKKINASCSTYRFSLKSKLFKDFYDLDLINTKSGNKFIPDIAKYSDIDYRRKLLAGLIDTDGYYGGGYRKDKVGRGSGSGCYSITTKSRQLADDIVFICGSLGYRNSLRTITKTIRSIDFMGIYYEVSFYVEANNQLPVLLERKKHCGKQFCISSNRVSIKLFETNPDMVYGFTLDSPSGLYITNNFVVTHNTGKTLFTLWAAQIYGELTGVPIPIENITRNIPELQKRISKLKSKAFLTMDEGSELDGSRFQEKQAKELKEYFTVMRKAAFIIFLCCTNPLKVSTYLREDRVRGVFFVKATGCMYYYANSPQNSHFTEILEVWSKDNVTRSIRLFGNYAPDAIINWAEYKGPLRDVYEKRKDDNIQAVFDKFGGKDDSIVNGVVEIPRTTINISDAAKLLRMRVGILKILVEDKIMPSVIIKGRVTLYMDEVKDYATKNNIVF
jgi:hypothetical protein